MRRKHLTSWKEMMLSLCVRGSSLISHTPSTVYSNLGRTL